MSTPISSALVSNAHKYVITECPSCHKRDIRGPFDTKQSARFMFVRAYCCLHCWWNVETLMFDDLAAAADKHQKAEAKKKKQREQARRT